MSQQDLYTRAKALYNKLITLEQDIEALAKEFT